MDWLLRHAKMIWGKRKKKKKVTVPGSNRRRSYHKPALLEERPGNNPTAVPKHRSDVAAETSEYKPTTPACFLKKPKKGPRAGLEPAARRGCHHEGEGSKSRP